MNFIYYKNIIVIIIDNNITYNEQSSSLTI
jgi:hypothetical protein